MVSCVGSGGWKVVRGDPVRSNDMSTDVIRQSREQRPALLALMYVGVTDRHVSFKRKRQLCHFVVCNAWHVSNTHRFRTA